MTLVPWRASDEYRNFRGMRPEVCELALVHGVGCALVVVNGRNAPAVTAAFVPRPAAPGEEPATVAR